MFSDKSVNHLESARAIKAEGMTCVFDRVRWIEFLILMPIGESTGVIGSGSFDPGKILIK